MVSSPELAACHLRIESNKRPCSRHCVCEICGSKSGDIKFTVFLHMMPCSVVYVTIFLKEFVVSVFLFALKTLILIGVVL